MVSFQQLQYFTVVAEERHFGRAAERLHFATSHLSHQIRQLEQSLGVTLLARTTRSVTITEAGAVILVHAHRVLADVEALKSEARRVADNAGTTLELRYVPGTGETATALVLSFREICPAVDVTLRKDTDRHIVSEIRDGRIAAGIARTHPPGLRSQLMRRSELRYVGLTRGGALSSAEEISIEDLDSEELILPSTDITTSNAVVAFFAGRGISPRFKYHRIVDELQVVDMLAIGLGNLLLTPPVARAVASYGGLVIPIAGPVPSSEEWLIWREDGVSSSLRAFVRAARAMDWQTAAAGQALLEEISSSKMVE